MSGYNTDDGYNQEVEDRLLNDSKANEAPNKHATLAVVVSEFLGSFCLVCVGVGAVWSSGLVENDIIKSERLLYISLSYGMAYTSLVYALSFDISLKDKLLGIRHLNPVITLALFLMKRINIQHLVYYWVAHTAAFGLALAMLPAMLPHSDMQPFDKLENTSFAQEFGASFICTFISTFIIITTSFGSAVWQENVVTIAQPLRRGPQDESEQQPQTVFELNCIISGITIFAATLASSGVSGGFMNPIFSLVVGYFSHNWEPATFFGPFCGAIFASFVARVTTYQTRSFGLNRMKTGD